MLLAALAVGIYSAVQNHRYPVEYQKEVLYWANQFEVDPNMVYAVISTESGFDPMAESNAGARGLMQMTSDTFDWVKSKIAAEEALTFNDLYTPDVSIRFGVCYLSYCLARYGQDLSTAAAAYHSGWGTVDTLLSDMAYSADGVRLHTFPYSQMNHYVNKINSSYYKYQQIYA